MCEYQHRATCRQPKGKSII